MLDFSHIYRSLKQVNKLHLLEGSAVRKENNFWELLKTIKPTPKNIVEIGTFRGIGTAILASLAEKVYTFDVLYQEATQYIWNLFDVKDKIDYRLVGVYRKDVPLIKVTRAIREELSIFLVINNMIDHEASRERIKIELEEIEFDIAFIDGNHKAKQVEDDFEIVKHCRRVIFHDIAENYINVIELMEKIGAKRINEFGYWEAK